MKKKSSKPKTKTSKAAAKTLGEMDYTTAVREILRKAGPSTVPIGGPTPIVDLNKYFKGQTIVFGGFSGGENYKTSSDDEV